MKDSDKTKEQLMSGLEEMRRRVAGLESSAGGQAEEEIKNLAKFSSENPNPVFRVSKDGTILYANRPGLPLLDALGCSVGQSAPEYWHKLILDALDSGSSEATEIEFQERIFSLLFASVTKAGYVNIYGIDITERKQAEEALRESEEQYRSIVNLSGEVGEAVIMLQDIDQGEGIQTFVSDEWPRIIGYSREELVGMSFFSLVHPKDHEVSQERHRSKMKGKVIAGLFEITIIRKDGTEVPVELTSAYTAYKGGHANVAYIRDVTERKQAEKALLKSQNLLNETGEMAKVGGWELDIETLRQTWTEEVYHIHELDMDYQPTLEKGINFYAPEAIPIISEAVQRAIDYGEPFDVVLPFITAKGNRRWVHAIGKAYRKNGKIIRVGGVFQDITERKQAEEKLRESEEKFRLIAETSPDYIVQTDSQGKIVYASPSVTRMLGYDPEELAGKDYVDLVPASTLSKAQPILGRAAKGEVVQNLEVELFHKGGKVIPVEISLAPIIERNEITGYLAISRDITGRKQAEEKLRESEEKFRSIVNLSGEIGEAVIMLQDTDQGEGIQTFVSDEWLHITGYSREELTGMSFFNLVHPKDHEVSQERHRSKMKGEVIPGLFEVTIIRKDGTEVPVELTSAYTKYKGGHADVVYIRDVTERKRAEEELRKSEMKYSTLVERSNDGIVILQDGSLRFANSKMLEMAGFSPEEIVGKSFIDFVSPEYRELVADRYKGRMLGEEVPDSYEIEFIAKDGSKIPVEISASIISYEEKPADMVMIRDITERKQVEEELEQEHRLFMGGPTVVFRWIATDGWPIDYASPNVYGLLGYTAEELTDGRHLFGDVTHPDDLPRIVEETKRAEEQVDCGHLICEYRVLDKDGKIRWVHEHTSLIRDGEGQVKYHHGYVTDITEQKKAEAERQEMERKAQVNSRLASVGEMAAGIAHEINNPLTGVVGFSELLLEKDLPDDLREDVGIIHDGSQRVAGIVKRLLTFARQHKPERTYTGINEIIESTITLRKYALETGNIEVNTLLDAELPWTMADRGQLQQVFMNIIVNAETEMKKAHGRGKLIIKTEQAANTIRISFADDGPGIAKENIGKVFDPFFTTREVGEGTGLGLSLSYDIVAEHKGTLYVKSRLGKGATFIIELPIVAEEEEKIEVVEAAKEDGKAIGGRILVVDDEPTILAFLKRVLGGEGYDVETESSGEEALGMIKNKRYRLILCDIKLPGLSGAELYEQIGKVAPSLQKRVMFITGDVTSADTREFLKRTKAPYVTKPFDIAKLKEEVNRNTAK